MAELQHLWDFSHPYYATHGNYFQSHQDAHLYFFSWDNFSDSLRKYSANEIMLEDKGNWLYDGDHDLNLLWRWDWERHDHKNENDDYFIDPTECANCEGEQDVCHQLHLFYMFQRKAKIASASIYVTEEDEPVIREWLTERAKVMQNIWEPLL
jgi:hypothetical protein